MSELDWDALETLEKAATPGPWSIKSPRPDHSVYYAKSGDVYVAESSWHGKSPIYPTKEGTGANFALISALRNAAPELISRARALTAAQARIGELEAERDEARNQAVGFVFDRLAKALGQSGWVGDDGTETWEGDVFATLMRLLRDSAAIDTETDIPAAKTVNALRSRIAELEARVETAERKEGLVLRRHENVFQAVDRLVDESVPYNKRLPRETKLSIAFAATYAALRADEEAHERAATSEAENTVLRSRIAELEAKLAEAERMHDGVVNAKEQFRSEAHRNGQDAALRSRVEKLEAALLRLGMTAALLLQNAEGCASNHYGHDYASKGEPGWIKDCRRDIDAARAALSPRVDDPAL